MKIYFINRYLLFALLFISTGIILILSPVKDLFLHIDCSSESRETKGVIKELKVNEKVVALTFDDGPSPTFTGKILDLLKWYNARATFFIIGEQAEKFPEIVIREIKEGHEIGNHMYHHDEVWRMLPLDLKRDLERSEQVIYQITRKKVALYRPTSGFYNDKIIGIARSMNYKVILWSLDSRDWTGRKGWIIAGNILKGVRPGSIILFHDFGGDRSNTINALEVLLLELVKNGYQFVTISDLLEKNLAQ
ncbi:MAG TPA: polysaccharide deacetylase family protein [Bacillota bacterium]|nr:polysaccharide deacetylase family protein [Bacillota bacterium]